MDQETPNQPLINEPRNGGRSTRAYKVAGITLLACVLIVGQAMTAYFLLSQNSEIKSLEDQGKKLKSKIMNERSAASINKIHIPVGPVAKMYDMSMDKDTKSEEKDNAATDCQLKAIGLKLSEVPGFHPMCDERGLYQAEQCSMSHCWCVNPVNGQGIPGSMRSGRASCITAEAAGSMNIAMVVPE